MHIWKNCWQCNHETPQNRLNILVYPRVIQGFTKSPATSKATAFWTYSIDAYQFTQCQKCEAPSLHIDSYHIKDINENAHEKLAELNKNLKEHGASKSNYVSSISHPNFNNVPILEKKWSFNLPEEDMLLFFEIVSAYEKELFILALSGIRTLVDRYIVKKIGDIGSFELKLKKLLDESHINIKQFQILNTIIEGGNAASHRGFRPEREMVKAFLDIVEDIISLEYKTEKFDEYKEIIPKRGKK